MQKEIRQALEKLACDGDNHIVAIEGGSASGKTTLGEEIAGEFCCNVFHMDDFFLRPEQRTEERYAQPGGNIDRERFEDEVLRPLSRGRDVGYRRFDCRTFAFAEPTSVRFRKLSIVEGAYSMHPDLAGYYDLKIYLDISDEEQRKRVLARNGKEGAKMFFDRWIPLENKAFAWYAPKKHADIVVITGGEKDEQKA